MMPDSLETRLQRAQTLSEITSSAQETLAFYAEILRFQAGLSATLRAAFKIGHPSAAAEGWNSRALEDAFHLLAGHFPSFLDLIRRTGPEKLSSLAGELAGPASRERWHELFRCYWENDVFSSFSGEEAERLFFPRAFLQPLAELLAEAASERVEIPQRGRAGLPSRSACPLCGRPPQVSVLNREGEGAGRSLLCSLCGSGWRYKRICCPGCGEESPARLSYFRAADFPHIRVDACESCRSYIKTVDRTADARAVPLVDEVASLSLDIWAVEQGYIKIELNLIGI